VRGDPPPVDTSHARNTPRSGTLLMGENCEESGTRPDRDKPQ
jgi:hypothetical protein